MSDLSKAKKFIVDKNNSLKALHTSLGVSISSLAQYRQNPDKLRNAKWIVVHKIALEYEKIHKKK